MYEDGIDAIDNTTITDILYFLRKYEMTVIWYQFTTSQ